MNSAALYNHCLGLTLGRRKAAVDVAEYIETTPQAHIDALVAAGVLVRKEHPGLGGSVGFPVPPFVWYELAQPEPEPEPEQEWEVAGAHLVDGDVAFSFKKDDGSGHFFTLSVDELMEANERRK